MATNEDQKEQWATNNTIEEFHYDLITTIREDGLRKYEEQARYLLYRIPVWKDPKTGDQQAPPAFIVELEDVSEKVKEWIANASDIASSRAIVKESVSLLFENLGPKEKEYFNKNVRHLLRVRFI
jgi:hypothetical protein